MDALLKQTLQDDLKTSLKTGDKIRRLVLGSLMASIKNRELLKRGQLSKTTSDAAELETKSGLNDEEILETIGGEVKKRKESIVQFQAGGRDELVAKETEEMNILMAYMPEQMSEEDVRKEVQAIVTQLGVTDIKEMGKVIGAAMAKLKGKADGGLVSKFVKEILTK